MKALFITNPKDFDAPVNGGVQICSKEYYQIIETAGIAISFFNVNISLNIIYRIVRKLRLDSYMLYNVNSYKSQLNSVLLENNFDYVFINKAELVRFSKMIKQLNQSVKVVILSHGNESGDFLGDITRGFYQYNIVRKIINKVRLGLNIYTESYFRVRYVDLVLVMSETEAQLEYWLGAKKVLFIPRIFNSEYIEWNPNGKKIGYIGTLSHTPNLSALYSVLDAIQYLEMNPDFSIEIVGSPVCIGVELESKYNFVKYLGKLTDDELKIAVSAWSYFINPIFWFSRGASMKLKTAINWGLPIISTSAGTRGYKWKKGEIIMGGETPMEIANVLIDKNLFNKTEYWHTQSKLISQNGISIKELANSLVDLLNILP